MELSIKQGNVLLGGDDVIAHQVNCIGVMGRGVALAVKNKYPKVFVEYLDFCKKNDNDGDKLLGKAQFVEIAANNLTVVNLFGQNKLISATNTRPTSYDAIYDAMCAMRDKLLERNKPASIGFPYGMSSVRGGACWDVIYEMIKDVFKDTNFKINIWKL